LTKRNVRFSEAEIADNQDGSTQGQTGIFMSTFACRKALKVLLEADPQVQKAWNRCPRRARLYQNARKIVAQRTGSTFDQPVER